MPSSHLKTWSLAIPPTLDAMVVTLTRHGTTLPPPVLLLTHVSPTHQEREQLPDAQAHAQTLKLSLNTNVPVDQS